MAKKIFKMRKRSKKSKDLLKRKKWLKRLGIVAIVVSVLGLTGVAGVFAYYAKDLPSPDKVNLADMAQSTKIYDRSGEHLLYEVSGEERRTMVELDQVADYLKEATIAAEDKDFYEHHGFDWRGILRSVFTNVSSDNRVGGSTITQQFVKNSLLGPEKTYERKIKELILSLEIEFKYEKDEILKMYLNEIFYGSNAYGVEAAAETFFNKKASDLTLAESAYLAGLPQRPSYYSPYGTNTEEMKERQGWILDQMVELGYISAEEAGEAKSVELSFREPDDRIIAPHFVIYVKDQLIAKFGDKMVEQGGLSVTTTMDYDLQMKAEQVVGENIDRVEREFGGTNAALVAMDPRNGQVLAMQGSRHYFDYEHDGNVNVAIRDRQPGSSFKPFAYAQAFERGYTPDTMLFDLETDFGWDYKPSNYDGSQHGPVSMRSALATSLNIPAVKTLYLAGYRETIDLAKKMGISGLNDPDKYGLSLVLGGGEVKLLDEVAAYGVFANDGIKQQKTVLLKVEDPSGSVLIDNTVTPEGERVMGEQTARNINSILSDNGARTPAFGSRSALTLGDRPVAAKTGTTQEYRDAWTVGYTPSLVAGVWTGNNDNTPMSQGAAGIYAAAPIWQSFMGQALDGKSYESFIPSEPISVDKPVLAGKIGREYKMRIEKNTGLLATEDCPAEIVEERTYNDPHSILHYVIKEDPRGPYPDNPAADQQYEKWEGPVRGWSSGKYSGGSPPKDTSHLCSSDLKPSISITSPKSGWNATEEYMTVSTAVSAPHGVKQVEFYWDGGLVGTDTSEPYSYGIKVSNKGNGTHSITAKVVDRIGNTAQASASIDVQYSAPSTPLSVSLTGPSGGAKAQTDFPLTISASVSGGTPTKVDLYAGSALVKSISGGGSNYSASWVYPGPGNYQVYAAATDNSGNVYYSSKSTITVN